MPEIKQLGICELLVEYKECHKICQFCVVDFPTAILGIHNSESLRLITIHFDCIGAEISQVLPETEGKMYVNAIQNDADSDEFSIKIKREYKDLFTSMGNMNTWMHLVPNVY